MEYDVFISHAWEDKEAVALPLAAALETVGAKVWLDVLTIGWGDSLSASIDRGLARSRYGIVVLSPNFFKKEWTQRELQGLVRRQVGERRTVILPLYYELTNEDLVAHSPTLADAAGLEWSLGPEVLARRFKSMLSDEPRVVGNEDATAPKVGAESMMARAKALLQGNQQIPLEDLLQRETDAVIDTLNSPAYGTNHLPADGSPFDVFKRRVAAYDELLASLNAVQVAIAYYGGSEHHVALRRSLERLADHANGVGKQSYGGLSVLLDLQWYPSVVSFHRAGAAAMAAERWGNLRPLFKEGTAAERPLEQRRVPMILKMAPRQPYIDTHSAEWLPKESAEEKSRPYTPAEDHLAERVKTALAWLGIDDHEAERVFDAWILLAQVAYLDVPSDQGRYNEYFSTGRWWRVRSTYRGWEHSPQGLLEKKVLADGDGSAVLTSGVAGGKASAFLAGVKMARELVESSMRRHP